MAQFRIDQNHLIGQIRFDFFAAERVTGKQVVAVFANPLEAGFETIKIKKMGDHDDQSAGAASAKKTAECSLQTGTAGGFQALEEMQRPPDLVLAVACRHFLDYTVGKRHQTDTIVIDEADIGDRSGQPARKIELGRRAEVHRAADVDENEEGQIGLLLEKPQDQAIEPEVGSPVEVAGIVAWRIGPVIGEDHSRPGTPRTMMPAHMAGYRTPCQHRQMLKLAKKFFAEQHAFLNQEIYLDAVARCPPLRGAGSAIRRAPAPIPGFAQEWRRYPRAALPLQSSAIRGAAAPARPRRARPRRIRRPDRSSAHAPWPRG